MKIAASVKMRRRIARPKAGNLVPVGRSLPARDAWQKRRKRRGLGGIADAPLARDVRKHGA